MVSEPRPSKHQLLLVGAILAAGVFLRFYMLDFQSLFRDEGYTLAIVNKDWSGFWAEAMVDPSHPPMYYLFLWGWCQVFSCSCFAMRGFSAFFSCLTFIPLLIVPIPVRSFTTRVLLISLFSFSCAAISGAQEARPYPFLGFLLTTLFCQASYFLKQPSRKQEIGLVAIIALILTTDYVPWPCLALMALLFPKLIRPLALAVCISFSEVLRLMSLGAKFGQRVPLSPDTIPKFFLSLPFSAVTGDFASGLTRSLVALIFCGWISYFLVFHYRRLAPLAFFTWTIIAVAAWKGGLATQASFVSRTVYLTPLIAILLVAPLDRFGIRVRILLGASLVTISTFNIIRGQYYFTEHRGGWKQASRVLFERKDTDEVLASEPTMLRYYYPGEVRVATSDAVEPTSSGLYYFADNPFAVKSLEERLRGQHRDFTTTRYVNVFVVRVQPATQEPLRL